MADNDPSPTVRPELPRVAAATADGRDLLLARLKAAVPEAFGDGQLDLGRLRDLLGEAATDASAPGAEPYALNWPGKRAAMRMIEAPLTEALHPDEAASVSWDKAAHVFIEGENLSVLRLLHDTYFSAVKLIYIDPPYNTGSDLIYHDDFRDQKRAYLVQTGQLTDDGIATTSEVDASGMKHSRWLSMIYPRLLVAKQILADKGLIMISINDVEAPNLRRLCDEVFGEENFIAQMVWEKGRKNDAKLISVGHEYVIIYAKNLVALKADKTIWREEKPGAREIWDRYVELRTEHGDDDKLIEAALQKWFSDLPRSHPSKKWSRYKRVDNNGPWRDATISWPGGGGPTYDVIHPTTGKPCAVPEGGWRFSSPETMKNRINFGLVAFRDDHNEPPFRKSYLRPPADNTEDDLIDGELEADDSDEDQAELATMVRGTYFYKQALVSVAHFQSMMGGKVFDNPKDHEELMRLFKYVTADTPDPIILDFFAGSGSSGEAVLRMAANGRPGARFIMVQAGETILDKGRTAKNARDKGFKTIADITRERLRLVCGDLPGKPGFRAFRWGESQRQEWTGVTENSEQGYLTGLAEAAESSFVDGWTAEKLLWEVALRERLPLTANVTVLTAGVLTQLWRVSGRIASDQPERSIVVCFDKEITLDDASALGLTADQTFICRDTALDDSVAANLAMQCNLKVL